MRTRKGLGRNLGKGYKNLVVRDPVVHSMSRHGIKQRVSWRVKDKGMWLNAKSKGAREMVTEAYHGSKNFMTPDILRYGKSKRDRAYELSSGRGFENDTIYGVTVVDDKNGELVKRHDLSTSFNTKEDAENYIKNKLTVLNAKGYSAVITEIKKLPVDEKRKVFLGLGYGVAGEGTRSLDFRTENLSPKLAKEMVKIIRYYNNFDYKKVNKALSKIQNKVDGIEIGRENSPVMYLYIPYWIEGTKRKPRRKLENYERVEIYNQIKDAFKEAKVDEVSEMEGVEAPYKVRLWWD